MPQFCLLFYAILQFWRPKGGGHGTMAPPKYAPDWIGKSGGGAMIFFWSFRNRSFTQPADKRASTSWFRHSSIVLQINPIIYTKSFVQTFFTKDFMKVFVKLRQNRNAVDGDEFQLLQPKTIFFLQSFSQVDCLASHAIEILSFTKT